jgi:copper chaperone CopZ
MALFLVMTLFAGCGGETDQLTFFTEGNCEACGGLIQEVLEAQAGIESANWDYQTSLTTVVFEVGEIDEEAIQQALAKAGFRTGYFEPDPAAREALPACCQESVARKLQPTAPAGH